MYSLTDIKRIAQIKTQDRSVLSRYSNFRLQEQTENRSSYLAYDSELAKDVKLNIAVYDDCENWCSSNFLTFYNMLKTDDVTSVNYPLNWTIVNSIPVPIEEISIMNEYDPLEFLVYTEEVDKPIKLDPSMALSDCVLAIGRI